MKQKIPKAGLNLGKGGITEEFILEVKRRLEKQKVLKIRILRSARGENKRELAERISREVEAKVTDVRGNTLVLERDGE